jgi:hypothetical protein
MNKLIIKEGIRDLVSNAPENYSNNPFLRAYIQAIPFAGNLIDNIVTSKWQEINQKRIGLFLEAVSDEFKQLEETMIDKSFLESDEFVDLFVKSTRLVTNTSNKEKIELYTKILKGSLIQKSIFTPDDYLNVVAELTSNEIAFAKNFYDLKITGNPYRDKGNDIQYTSNYFSNVTTEQAEYYFKRLEKVGLVSEIIGFSDGGSNYKLTELFKSLMNYIK